MTDFRTRKDTKRTFPLRDKNTTLSDFIQFQTQNEARLLKSADTRRAVSKPKFREVRADSLRGDTLNSHIEAAKSMSFDDLQTVSVPLLTTADTVRMVANQLKTYDDAQAYIARKSREYGGKNRYYTSPEYRLLFPHIKKLYQEHMAEKSTTFHKAMTEVGAKYGDKVEYSMGSPFGQIVEYEGVIVKSSKGLPRVRITKTTDPESPKFRRWHKGWKKL